MKRTLRKRDSLWEVSVPLRAPVRGIWRYGTFAEAWDHLWRTGYPPGLPSEIKMAVRQPEPAPLGIEYLADVDDAVHDAFDSTNGLLAARISVPPLTPAESSEVKRDSPEPLTFPGTPLSVPASPKPLMGDSEEPMSDEEVLLRWEELHPAPPASPWKSRAMAVGLTAALTILLLVLLGPFSQFAPFSQRDSLAPLYSVAPTVSRPTETPVPHPVSGTGKSHASIQTKDRSWITACVDGGVVFSKLFTAGSKDSVDFVDRAVVRMGNAGPVEITLDGKPVGSLGETGQVRVIELARGAQRFLAGGETEDCTLTRSR